MLLIVREPSSVFRYVAGRCVQQSVQQVVQSQAGAKLAQKARRLRIA